MSLKLRFASRKVEATKVTLQWLGKNSRSSQFAVILFVYPQQPQWMYSVYILQWYNTLARLLSMYRTENKYSYRRYVFLRDPICAAVRQQKGQRDREKQCNVGIGHDNQRLIARLCNVHHLIQRTRCDGNCFCSQLK